MNSKILKKKWILKVKNYNNKKKKGNLLLENMKMLIIPMQNSKIL